MTAPKVASNSAYELANAVYHLEPEVMRAFLKTLSVLYIASGHHRGTTEGNTFHLWLGQRLDQIVRDGNLL